MEAFGLERLVPALAGRQTTAEMHRNVAREWHKASSQRQNGTPRKKKGYPDRSYHHSGPVLHLCRADMARYRLESGYDYYL